MTLEYDPSYEAYCQELLLQEYQESVDFLDKINRELMDIRICELEQLI